MPSARDGEPPRRILGMMLLALAMLPNALVASLRGGMLVYREVEKSGGAAEAEAEPVVCG
mgnify:CR=1 FL=1